MPAPDLKVFSQVTESARPRRMWLFGTLVVLLLVAAAAWAGQRALQARDHLEQARGQLELARSALLDRRLEDAQHAVLLAGRQTVRARALTDDPVTRALSHLPVAGRSFETARGIANGADDLARTVLPQALESARTLDPKKLRRPDGTIDLRVLTQAQPGVDLAAARAEALAEQVRQLPTAWVLGTVGGAHREFVAQSAQLAEALRGAAEALDVAPSMLGAERPRRWFVMVQQTSESRGTGGLTGGFAVLEVDKGRLQVRQQGSNAELIDGQIAPVGLPEDFVNRYGALGSFADWRNINLSPDLPAVSRYLVQRWKTQTGQHLDGVIAMDATALADLLQGSGPVSVGPGMPIPPEGIQDYLALGQYVDGGDQLERKEKLTFVSRAMIRRFTDGSGDSAALLRGLSSALRSGHVRIATDDPALAPALRRTGVDGGLPRDGTPFVYPVVFNAAGNKLDYFLSREVSYKGGSCDGARRVTTVVLKLVTDPPAITSLPAYVTIRQQDGDVGHSLVNRLGVSVYATKGSRLLKATLDGKELGATLSADPYVESATEAGLPVWLTYMDLQPAVARELVLTLEEPVVRGAPRVYEQPLARPLTKRVTVPTCS